MGLLHKSFDDSYIFSSKANEYLLEIQDFESRKFLANNLTEKDISIEHMPTQFNDTFQSLNKLQIFSPFPNLDFNTINEVNA